MLRTINPLEGLLKVAGEVVKVVAADQLFSWAVRSISPPEGWLAWALREDEDPAVVKPGGRCHRDGVKDVLFIRMSPIECVIEDAGLQSADGHEFTGRLHFRVRVIPEPAELAAFRRTVLGSSQTLTRSDFERYLQWQARKVLAELAGQHPADELLKPIENSELRRLVENRLGAACLAGGLALEGPMIAVFESERYLDHRRRESDLDRQRREADARAQIQQALAAAQSQRLNHLIAMLEQMRETSKQHGGRTLMDLLQAFSPAERGQMYAALWKLIPTARRTRYVAAVSGQELLLFDPADLQRPARRHRLPETLGSLRSVSMDTRSRELGVLLVGAATGVYMVEVESGDVIRTLAAGHDPARTVRGGVNAAGLGDEWILASHSELGVMSWPRDGGDESAARFLLEDLTANAETVRCIHAAENDAWVAIDKRVVRFSPDAGAWWSETVLYTGSPAPISALTLTRDAIYAGNTEGQLLHWPLSEPAGMTVIRRATGLPVESVDIVDAGGVDWLVAADGQNALTATVIGDHHACRYESGAARVRRAATAVDLFVAMNDNRDRLIAWRPDKPAAPAATVVVPYLTGGSIQDLCLVPA